MASNLHLAPGQTLKQRLKLSPGQLMGIGLLAKSLPELRAAIVEEIACNPAIDDLSHSLESPLSDVARANERAERRDEPDYPADDFIPGTSADDEAAERRQAFFDRQVTEETLQEHLLSQLPFSDIPRADWPIIEILIGDLDDSGFYRGSSVDVQMSFGKSEAEMDAIFAAVQTLDPPGCCARNVRECLLAQMDALVGNPLAPAVRKIVESHLDEIATGETAAVRSALGLTDAEFAAALAALRTLSPRPGAAYPSQRARIEYVNPEIHAVERDGYWYAETDERSLPEIRISPKFEAMLKDSDQTEEVRAYVRERIERAQTLREAIALRQRTVKSIAQGAFDRQQAFFTRGFAALAPLTETEMAKAVGVDVSTVSRTVRDKYAETPFGTVELRRFFTSGVKTADGTDISQEAALRALKDAVEAEDPSAPLSDERLAAALREKGLPLARRTVAKYRDRLGIPAAAARISQSLAGRENDIM